MAVILPWSRDEKRPHWEATSEARVCGRSGAQALAPLEAPRPGPRADERHARRIAAEDARVAIYTEALMAITSSTWSPSSWREFPAQHQVEWPDDASADAVRARIKTLPALVLAGEARALRSSLAQVAEGRAFLLQAGDCAESFHDFSAISIREKLKILLQMSAVLTYGAALPIVKVGR